MVPICPKAEACRPTAGDQRGFSRCAMRAVSDQKGTRDVWVLLRQHAGDPQLHLLLVFAEGRETSEDGQNLVIFGDTALFSDPADEKELVPDHTIGCPEARKPWENAGRCVESRGGLETNAGDDVVSDGQPPAPKTLTDDPVVSHAAK